MSIPPPARTAVVSRAHRLLDALAAALVLGGATLFSFAFAGLAQLHQAPEQAYAEGMVIDRLARYERLSAMSWAGLGIVALGIGVAVWGWLRHRASLRAG